MPVDASIPLGVKPPVMPDLDISKTFLTLGQLRYLNAEAARTQTQTDVAQADLAATQRLRAVDPTGLAPLSSLRTDALPPGAVPMPGPEAPATAASPPPAPAPLDTPTLARRYMAADPVKGVEIASKLFEHEKQGLENQKQRLEQVGTQMAIASAAYTGVTDQASLERANGLIAHVTGRGTSHLLQTYTPEGVEQFANFQRNAEQRLTQANKVVDQKIAQQKANTEAVLAQAETSKATTAAAAEAREARRETVIPGIFGGVPRPVYPQPGTVSGQPIPGTETPPTDSETLALALHRQGTAAHQRMVDLENKAVNVAGGAQKVATNAPLIGQYLTPKDVQLYNQARDEYLQAASRGEYGRMSPTLQGQFATLYAPQPGDTHDTVLQRRSSRVTQLEGERLRTNRPEGYVPPAERPLPAGAPGSAPGSVVSKPGDPGPPPSGHTRFSTSLDGKPISVDAATPEQAQGFLRRTYPGRTFELTPAHGVTTAQLKALASKHGKSEAEMRQIIEHNHDYIVP